MRIEKKWWAVIETPGDWRQVVLLSENEPKSIIEKETGVVRHWYVDSGDFHMTTVELLYGGVGDDLYIDPKFSKLFETPRQITLTVDIEE